MLRQAISVLCGVDTAEGRRDRYEQSPAREVIADLGLVEQTFSDHAAHAVPDDDEAIAMLPAPLYYHRGHLYDSANRDDLLVYMITEHGLRTVLCAGNGVSQEPRALAAAGFDVTALDISPVAVRFAEAFRGDTRDLARFVAPQLHRPGGRVEFVVGDLMDITVCPGPFDVVIERRTVQRFAEQQWAAALSALSERLSETGILVSLCFDDDFPPELGWSQHKSGLFHASESWFREHGWTIWGNVPSSTLTGRAAWLIRCGTMKPPPSGKCAG